MEPKLILLNTAITTEDKLVHLKNLRDQIKVMQAEYDLIAGDLKAGYFADHDVYTTTRGLVLATYKTQLRTQFKTTEFKLAEPKLYDAYLDIKSVKTFLLK